MTNGPGVGGQGVDGQGKEAPKYQEAQPPGQEQSQKSGNQNQNLGNQLGNDIGQIGDLSKDADTDKQSGVELAKAVGTQGRAGEKNISIAWVDVRLPGGLSANFVVRTAPGNSLEVLVEQRSYKKTYTGSGAITTQVLPIAPIGTSGKLIARDTTTGESLEQPWQWVHLGGADLPGLWEKIKKFFWKSNI
jgi:hypothetical protein